MIRRFPLFLAALICGTAAAPSAPSFAFQAMPGAEDPYEILAPSEPSALIDVTGQHGPSIEAARDMARELGGRWRVAIWNRFANTPNRAYGSGIELVPGGIHSETQVEHAARLFMSSHPSILRADPAKLAKYRITHALGKWVIQFQQTEAGYPVANAFVHLVFTDSGRLYAFGSNFYHGVSVPSGPSVVLESAIGMARAALPYDPASELTPMRPDETMFLPMLENGPDGPRMVFRLAHRTEIPTSEPYGLYATYVDAQTGEILIRENLVENAYSGTSRGDVEIPSYCAGNTPDIPFAHMNVMISNNVVTSNADTAVTDSMGSFSLGGDLGQQTYTAEFNGPVVNVNCTDCGGDAVATGPIEPDVPVNIYFDSGTFRADERDCFYFVNRISDYIKSIDSLWAYPKITANVNVNQNCNANWAGTVLNFFHSGGACHNTGELGDVVAHEFGHAVQYSLLGGQGPNGMGEGNGDIAGTFISDAPIIGIGIRNCDNGLNCPGSSCRTCENTLIYPNNVIGQPIHDAGRVICGFNWDARQGLEAKYGPAAGKEKCAQLWHFSRKMFGNPAYDQPDQVHDYFVLDDDDGNLGNGTPDYDELCQAATNHGFSCPPILLGVFITHTELGNTSDTQNPYEVTALITSTLAPLNPDSLLVRYRLDGAGDYTTLEMTPTGGHQDEYHAYIPAQECGTNVDYFIVAEDGLGNRKTEPLDAPAATFPFSIANIRYAQTFEASSDWTQDPTHTALTGAFVRIDPNGTGFQPNDDASPPPGVFAWVTAQNTAGDGVDDVDIGVSATRSPIVDLGDVPGAHLSMKYFHGQRDAGGDSLGDFFRISVSNDGGATYPADLVTVGDVIHAAAWTSLEVDLETVLPLTSEMCLRVQASDGPSLGDIIEGGIDEIYILTCDPPPPPPQDTIPPEVTILSPNGGEYLEIDSTESITWVASDNVGVTSVTILLSTDGGATYPTVLATIEQPLSPFAWLVPNEPTQSARIKIVAQDAAALSAEDASDSNFTIGPTLSAPPEIVLTAPVGGEVIDATSTFDITWNATDDGGVTGVAIDLSLDGGETYPIAIAIGEENDGVYTWAVIDSTTTQARVRVTALDADAQTDSDASPSDFTVTLPATGVAPGTRVPDRLTLGPSVPEPFRENAVVRFGLPRPTAIDLVVYSVEGRIVRRLASGPTPAGTWESVWNGKDDSGSRVPSGLYFLRLSTPEGTATRRITFLR